nr:hypothetical protein LKV13_04765 [Borrelia sp. BU AG58]
MIYVSMLNILLLVFFVGCKEYGFKAAAKFEAELVQEDPRVLSQRAAEEVSNHTGMGVEEIKTLSKGDLEQMASHVKNDSNKTLESARGNNGVGVKETPELIKEIKESGEKLNLAFKALAGAGYGGNVVGPVMANIGDTMKRLSLIEKLSGIVEGNGTTEEARRALDAFGGDSGSCRRSINERDRIKNAGIKACMKSLMGNINSGFYSGVCNQLRDALVDAPENYKEALRSLMNAADSLSTAAGLVENKLYS